MSSIPLLVITAMSDASLARFQAAGFEPIIAVEDDQWTAAINRQGPEIQAVLTKGTTGLSAAQMDQLPALRIICALGVGHERIDVGAAAERNIVVTHSPGANATSVADHAMALLLAITRDIVRVDRLARLGDWDKRTRPEVSGKRLGLLGLGNIGREIARRGAHGFTMQVAYHSRHRQPAAEPGWEYLPSTLALAQWADYLVVAIPGGEATKHLVNAEVLQALGPKGFLINIARGSIVDTPALIAALNNGQIAGAGLDVVEGEPNVPPALVALENVIITPHLAGRSPNSVEAMVTAVLENLTAHFAGQPVPSPVS